MYRDVGGIASAYSLALIAAVVGSACVGAAALRRQGFSARDCFQIQCALALIGLLGAKLASLVERGGTLLPLAQELSHGYRYPGAVIALVLGLAIFSRHLAHGASIAALGDAIAPSIGVGGAILRVGCFLHGCCFGIPSRLSWAVRFPADSLAWHAHIGAGWIGPASFASLPVHPLQLYFALCSLLAATLAWRVQRHPHRSGQVLLTFLTADGLGKFALEHIRAERVPLVPQASLIIGLGALCGLLLMVFRQRAARRGRGAAGSDGQGGTPGSSGVLFNGRPSAMP